MSEQGQTEVESPDRRAFRVEVRSFLDAHAEPLAEVDPWTVSDFPDDAEAAAHFSRGRAWQATLADMGGRESPGRPNTGVGVETPGWVGSSPRRQLVSDPTRGS